MLRIIQTENKYWIKKRIDSREHLFRFLSILSCTPTELSMSQGELYVCLLYVSAISNKVINCIVLNVESYDEDISIFYDSRVDFIVVTTNSAIYTLDKLMKEIDMFRIYSSISSIGYISSSQMIFVAEELFISFINQDGYCCDAYNTGFIEDIKLTSDGLKIYREHDVIYITTDGNRISSIHYPKKKG